MSTITFVTTIGQGESPGVTAGIYTRTTVVGVAPSASTSPSPTSAPTTSTSSSTTVAPFGNTDTPSLLPSSSTTAPPSGASTPATSSGSTSSTSATSGATSQSASAAPSSSGASNTGLIAGVAVLAVLLAIALGVILLLLLRRKRRSYRTDGSRPETRGSPEMINAKPSRNNITATEIEASLLAGSARGAVMDDKQANAKFGKLNQEINDWVLSHFRHMNPNLYSTSQEVLHAIRHQPHYTSLLQDSRGKYLVLRGIVADALTDAFDNGEINGFGDVFGMKERFPTNVGGREKATWRSSTVLLLEKEGGFRERQARAVETIAQRINYVTSNIAGVEHSEQRLRQLTTIVQSAAELALDLAKQRMNFVLLHPSEERFEPAVMDDVLQESQGEHLRGCTVLSVVFPAVVRYGDEQGEGFDRRNVISKALVLAAAEGRAI